MIQYRCFGPTRFSMGEERHFHSGAYPLPLATIVGGMGKGEENPKKLTLCKEVTRIPKMVHANPHMATTQTSLLCNQETRTHMLECTPNP
jgi:hypothetical protein